jgi:hypothetical protein
VLRVVLSSSVSGNTLPVNYGMNQASFALSTSEAVGDMGIVVLVGHYSDENRETLERISLLNLGPGIALINRFGISINGEPITTSVFEKLEPGQETLWFDAPLLKVWLDLLPTRDLAKYEGLTNVAGMWDIKVLIQITTDGRRSFSWPVRLTRRQGQDETFELQKLGDPV